MSFGYIKSKIDHMRKSGLVSGQSQGFGKHGGACPDWLIKEQKDRAEALQNRRQFSQSWRPADEIDAA